MINLTERLMDTFKTAMAKRDLATLDWCWLTARVLFDHHQPIDVDEVYVGKLDAIKMTAALIAYDPDRFYSMMNKEVK